MWVSGDEGVDSCGTGKCDQVLVVGVAPDGIRGGVGVVDDDALLPEDGDVRIGLFLGRVGSERLLMEDLLELSEEVRRDDGLEGRPGSSRSLAVGPLG